jgi:hypothetical protein
MKLKLGVVALGVSLLVAGAGLRARAQESDKTWSVKADYIEACSCHLFCSCYFYTSPEGGHMCEFNNAIKIAEGHVGDVKVDGCKVWLSGDLGGDFSKGEMKSLVVTFDPAVKKEQREAINFLMGKIYPVKWAATAIDEAPITWEKTEDTAHAKLGDVGEVKLTAAKDDTGKQTIIHNLKYWGAQRNTGFYLYHSEHRYKGHGHDYSYKDNNGFCIHIESDGKLEKK